MTSSSNAFARRKAFATTVRRPFKRPRAGGSAGVIALRKVVAMEKQREKKWFDVSIIDASIAIVGLNSSLHVVPEGTGEQERIGRKINIRSIYGRFSMTVPISAEVKPIGITMSLILDRQHNNAAAPAAASARLEEDHWLGYNILAEKDRFKTLWEQRFFLGKNGYVYDNVSATNEQNSDAQLIEFYKKFKKPIEISYDDSVATGALTSNDSSIVFLAFKPSADEVVAVTGYTRIRFTD